MSVPGPNSDQPWGGPGIQPWRGSRLFPVAHQVALARQRRHLSVARQVVLARQRRHLPVARVASIRPFMPQHSSSWC